MKYWHCHYEHEPPHERIWDFVDGHTMLAQIRKPYPFSMGCHYTIHPTGNTTGIIGSTTAGVKNTKEYIEQRLKHGEPK